jgi:predicted ribonuclease YlaK
MLGIDFVPLQLFRGASFTGTVVIADEVQVLESTELLTIGTRTGEKSKLILLGDLDQRDEKIEKQETGLYKFLSHPLTRKSPLVASVYLSSWERSPAAELFPKGFND